MRARALAVGLLTTLACGVALAQPRPQTDASGNVQNNGAGLREVLAAFDKTSKRHPSYAEYIKRLRGGVGLVFVPGILGSTLESRSAGQIWGFGMPEAAKLALPASLIDPQAPSDVKAKIAESVLGVSLYGDAMKMVRASAAGAGIPANRIVGCGYDWRRDVRAGAEDLQKCIDEAPELAGIEALVVVAHSMGGVVSWVWQQKYAPLGRLPSDAPIIAFAVLGSPLAGSCEIVRMVESGYVQPIAKDEYVRETRFRALLPNFRNMQDRFVNAITGHFSDAVRPLVLSWPGAFNLSPPPPASRHRTNCAPVPFNPNDLGDDRVLHHYMPEFWSAPVGVDMLRGATPPAGFAGAIRQAASFRATFAPTTLHTPTYFFASQAWETPSQATVVPAENYRRASEPWGMVPGDGRVPFLAAVPEGVKPATVEPLRSVHGNLPEDPDFHAFFFADRLPRVLAAWQATRLMQFSWDNTDFLKDYIADKGPFALVADLYTAYEPDRGEPQPRYLVSAEARTIAETFNIALCGAGAVCPDYERTKRLAPRLRNRPSALASLYAASLRNTSMSVDDKAFVRAQQGLALAFDNNWSAAASTLREARGLLEERRTRAARPESKQEKDLRIAVDANLGKALVLRGFCEDAKEPLRSAAAAGSGLAKSTLSGVCTDRETGKVAALR